MLTAGQLHAEHWRPAACLGWSGETKLVAVIASRFRATGDVFQRLGSVTAWPFVRYWSVSKQRWQPLALSVRLLNDSGQSVSASSDDLIAGRDLVFVERDESSGEVTYRMHVRERTSRRIVLALENVTPVKFALLTLFEPGALQTVTFLEKEQEDTWTTYQISRVGSGGSSLALGHAGSFLNRLEAVRRHLAGLPSDQSPPLAPR